MKNQSKAGAASLLNALRNSAKQSPKLIGPDAARRTRDYVLSRRDADGGFRGRAESSDLYYTMFALLCLDALDANDDGTVDVADPIFGLAHLFSSGPPPPAPHASNRPWRPIGERHGRERMSDPLPPVGSRAGSALHE